MLIDITALVFIIMVFSSKTIGCITLIIFFNEYLFKQLFAVKQRSHLSQ